MIAEDDSRRKLLDDLDARMLLDHHADARHVETLSLATLGATSAILGVVMVNVRPTGEPFYEWALSFAPWLLPFGGAVWFVGFFLVKRMEAAERRIQGLVKRLSQRHRCELSELPEMGAMHSWIRPGVLPRVVQATGLLGFILGAAAMLEGIAGWMR